MLLDIARDCAGVEAVGLRTLELGLGKDLITKKLQTCPEVITRNYVDFSYVVVYSERKKSFCKLLIGREYL